MVIDVSSPPLLDFQSIDYRNYQGALVISAQPVAESGATFTIFISSFYPLILINFVYYLFSALKIPPEDCCSWPIGELQYSVSTCSYYILAADLPMCLFEVSFEQHSEPVSLTLE